MADKEKTLKDSQTSEPTDATPDKVVMLGPDVEPHDDPLRVIGRRTRYVGDEMSFLRGYTVVIVGVLKGALGGVEYGYLKTEEEVRRAGGVGLSDRIEVAPYLPEEGRLSFATTDPRAIDLEAFSGLARLATKE